MTCLGTLHHGERLLIRMVRLVAADLCRAARRRQIEHDGGASGSDAYRVLEDFLSHLKVRGQRRVVLSVAPDPRLTPDEGLILDAFAAAQLDDYQTLDACLANLVGDVPPSAMGAAVCLVAQHFAMNGLWLHPLGVYSQVWDVRTTPTSTAVQ